MNYVKYAAELVVAATSEAQAKEKEYEAALSEYQKCKVAQDYLKARDNFQASQERLRTSRKDLLAALKGVKLPTFIDLGETGIFVSEYAEIVVAPIVKQEE